MVGQSTAVNTQSTTIDDKTKMYLRALASKKPFAMEITATPRAIFDQLEANWPPLTGWEKQAGIVQGQIKNFADTLLGLDVDPNTPLRFAINVAASPQAPLPAPDAPSLHAVFDAAQGTLTHRIYSEAEMPFDPTLDDVPVGMAILFQRMHKMCDARGRGVGSGPSPEHFPHSSDIIVDNEIEATPVNALPARPMPPPVMPPRPSPMPCPTGERDNSPNAIASFDIGPAISIE